MREIAELKRICSQISFLNFKFDVEPIMNLGTESDTHALLKIDYRAHNRDFRDSSVVGDIQTIQHIPLHLPKSQQINFIFERLVKILRHEAGECFYVNDKRPFNEHDQTDPISVLEKMFPLEEHWNKKYAR